MRLEPNLSPNKIYLEELKKFDLNNNNCLTQDLTKMEMNALTDYMKPGGALTINRSLRGQMNFSRSDFEKIKLMLQGMQKIPCFPTKINGFDNAVYRESGFFPGGISNPKDLQVNQVYQEKGFLSTSSTPFGVLPDKYKIMIVRPKYGRDISSFGSTASNEVEDEVLFPPNTKFKYLCLDRSRNRQIFTTDI